MADAMSETIKLIKPYGRATQARITVLDMLLSATHAISHAELESALLSAGRQIDRVTLYRALEWLVSKNLAHKIPGRDRVWRYSAAYRKPITTFIFIARTVTRPSAWPAPKRI